MNNVKNAVKAGQLFLITSKADMGAIFHAPAHRLPELGDLVYCRGLNAGLYEYVLVDLLNVQEMALDESVCWFGDALPHQMAWEPRYAMMDAEAFAAGAVVAAPDVYAAVARFFKEMPAEVHRERVRTVRPGRVIYWTVNAERQEVACGMVMDNRCGDNSVLTVATKVAGKLTCRRVWLSELKDVRICDDPGMASQEPNAGVFLREKLSPGTLVRISRAMSSPETAKRTVRARLGSHALVREVTGGDSPILHVTMCERNGAIRSFQTDAWSFPASAILN
jgi:hypothetical protein